MHFEWEEDAELVFEQIVLIFVVALLVFGSWCWQHLKVGCSAWFRHIGFWTDPRMEQLRCLNIAAVRLVEPGLSWFVTEAGSVKDNFINKYHNKIY